jgi:GDSL-like Lipase/Acylhydrolase family
VTRGEATGEAPAPSEAGRRGGLGNRGKTALLACFGAMCGLVGLELAVRLIEPRDALREYFERHDPVLHHKFIPGARGRHKTLEFDVAYDINSLGLRSGELARDKPPGSKRILMLGDSFTEGNGVQESETFSSRLQAKLDEARLGERLQVVNAGVGSYSPLLELLYLKTAGLELQPDLVILNFDLSDLHDDIQYTRLAEFDAGGEPVAVRPEPERGPGPWPIRLLVGFKELLKKHTRVYNFTRRRVFRFLNPLQKPDVSGDIRVDKYGMIRQCEGACDDHAWRLSYDYLSMIRDLLAAKGVDLWVTLYPYGNQISPREWEKGRTYWGFEPGRVYSTRPQELIAEFCRRSGIRVLNMCDEFRKASHTVYPLYYEYDGHWMPAGHEVVADVLYRELVASVGARDERATSASAGAATPVSTR